MNRKEKRTKKSEINILKDLVTVINQYFPELISQFNGLTDLRNQSYIKYKMKVIFIVRVMGFISFEDFKEKLRHWNREYNNFPMKPLGWKSPNEKYIEYQAL